MAKVQVTKVLGKPEDYRKVYFMCPGCKEIHAFNTTWEFNGDINKPTANPSILVTMGTSNPNYRCHSFIRDGFIQFLNDCNHELKGKTVELPDINEP